jgi:TetR/AcrR family transcriptional regulator
MAPDTTNTTAQSILLHAEELFMRRGYKAVSISDIIEAAQITKPTLYAYFRGKDELFVAVILHAVEQLGSDLAAVPTDAPVPTRLLGVARALVRFQEYDVRLMRREMAEHLPADAQQRLNAAFFAQVFAPVIALMHEGVATGTLAPRDPGLLAGLFMAMLDGIHGQAPSEWATATLTPELIVEVFLQGTASTAH